MHDLHLVPVGKRWQEKLENLVMMSLLELGPVTFGSVTGKIATLEPRVSLLQPVFTAGEYLILK